MCRRNSTKGELVTSNSYKTFGYSEEGVMVMIGLDNKWGAINMDAKELFPCRYDSIYFARSMDSLYLYKEGIKEVYSLEDVLKK